MFRRIALFIMVALLLPTFTGCGTLKEGIAKHINSNKMEQADVEREAYFTDLEEQIAEEQAMAVPAALVSVQDLGAAQSSGSNEESDQAELAVISSLDVLEGDDSKIDGSEAFLAAFDARVAFVNELAENGFTNVSFVKYDIETMLMNIMFSDSEEKKAFVRIFNANHAKEWDLASEEVVAFISNPELMDIVISLLQERESRYESYTAEQMQILKRQAHKYYSDKFLRQRDEKYSEDRLRWFASYAR